MPNTQMLLTGGYVLRKVRSCAIHRPETVGAGIAGEKSPAADLQSR